MGEYYDKDKFTGSRPGGPAGGPMPPPPPPRPYQTPPKKSGSSGWYSWPVIIICFSLGIWPLALVLLFYNIFSDGKKRPASAARPRPADYDAQARSAVERAMHKAESRVNQAEKQVGRAFDQAGESVDQAVERAMAQMERTLERTARQVERTGRPARRSAPPPPKAQPVKAAKPVKEKKSKAKPAGVLLRILGVICFAIAGLLGFGSLMDGFIDPIPIKIMTG